MEMTSVTTDFCTVI